MRFSAFRGEIMNKMSLSARCSAMFALYYRVFYPAFIMFSSYMVLSGFEADFVAKMMTLSPATGRLSLSTFTQPSAL